MSKAFGNVLVVERSGLSFDCFPDFRVSPLLVAVKVSYEIDHGFLVDDSVREEQQHIPSGFSIVLRSSEIRKRRVLYESKD
jgi:hypothetical protein